MLAERIKKKGLVGAIRILSTGSIMSEDVSPYSPAREFREEVYAKKLTKQINMPCRGFDREDQISRTKMSISS